MKRRNVETSKRRNQGAGRRSINALRFRCRDVCASGFTLLEMLVALTLVAALAAVVAPMFGNDQRLRVMAAATVIISDIELAQVMSIARPEAPVVVRFDTNDATYWLAYASAPDTPITRVDTGEPYLVMLGSGRAQGAVGVALAVEQMTGDTITFASHGGLTDFATTPLIKISDGARGIQLAISPMTGSIEETEFTPQQEVVELEPPLAD